MNGEKTAGGLTGSHVKEPDLVEKEIEGLLRIYFNKNKTYVFIRFYSEETSWIFMGFELPIKLSFDTGFLNSEVWIDQDLIELLQKITGQIIREAE